MRLHLPCELLALCFYYDTYVFTACSVCSVILSCSGFDLCSGLQSQFARHLTVCAEVDRMLVYLGPHLQLKCHKSKSQHVKLSVSRCLCQPESAASVISQPFTLPVNSLYMMGQQPLSELGPSGFGDTLTSSVRDKPHSATDSGWESPEPHLTLTQSCTLNRHFNIVGSKLITLGKLYLPRARRLGESCIASEYLPETCSDVPGCQGTSCLQDRFYLCLPHLCSRRQSSRCLSTF